MSERYRNEFSKERDVRKAARLIAKGLPKNDIVNTLNRENPEHSTQSWRNWLGRNDDAIQKEADRIKRTGQAGSSSDIQTDSDDEGVSQRPLAASNRSKKRHRGLSSSEAGPAKRKPQAGKRVHEFQEDSEDQDVLDQERSRGKNKNSRTSPDWPQDSEDEDEEDQLESTPAVSRAKQTKQTPHRPKFKLKPKPRASAPAGRLGVAHLGGDDPSEGQDNQEARPEPGSSARQPRAHSAPPPAQDDDDDQQQQSSSSSEEEEESDSEQRGVFTETQRNELEPSTLEQEPVLSLDLDEDEDEEDEREEASSREYVAQTLQVRRPEDGGRVNAEGSQRKDKGKSTGSPAKKDRQQQSEGLSREQARKMVHSSKNTSGAKISWASPGGTQQAAGTQTPKATSSKDVAAASKARRQKEDADPFRSRSTGGTRLEDSVCEPNDNDRRRNEIKSLVAFAERWSITVLAAWDLSFRCSNMQHLMGLYMRERRFGLSDLSEREKLMLKSGYWSAADDQAVLDQSSDRRWTRIESNRTLEAIACRRSFLTSGF